MFIDAVGGKGRMSERVQTCFLRLSRLKEILEVWKHSICTSRTSLIAVLTTWDSHFSECSAVAAKDHCSGLCFNICTCEITAVTWSFWWDVWTFCSMWVVTVRVSLKRRRDNFQLCRCKQNLITSGCFPAVSVSKSGCFWPDDGTFSDVFFLLFWRMFSTRTCNVLWPC